MDPAVDYWTMLAEAEMAGVPWCYSLSAEARIDDEYRARLAHLYVARAVGLPDAGVNGYPPERIERDLDALADFTLQPLSDFAARFRPPPAVVPGGGANGDRPVPPI